MQGLFALVFLSALFCAHCTELRIVHGSPDAPAIDVYINGGLPTRFTNVKYKDITRYIWTRPGTYNITVVATGTKTPVLFNTTAQLAGDFSPYSIATGGFLANIKPYIFSDDKVPPRRGYGALRFVHISPDAPAVDIRIDGQTQRLFSNVAFGQATDYAEVTRGDYTIQILATGTNNIVAESDFRAIADVPSSLWAEGSVAQKTFQAILSRDL